MKRLRYLALFVSLLLVGFVVQGFGQAATPQYGGELIYAWSAEPSSLFPGFDMGQGEQEIWLNTYENLVILSADGEIVPELAKSWEFSEDSKSCTFHLEEGVFFTDGTPFNAAAVKFVFDEEIEKKYKMVNLLEGIEEIEVVDDYTVTFHFETTLAAFLPNMANRALCIWNPTAYTANGAEWMASNMIGTGPFILDEWKHGESIRFVKNPNYWRAGLPYLDAISYLIVPEASVRALMIESGDADRTVRLNDYDLTLLDQNANISVTTVPGLRQYYCIMNNTKHPLDNVLVRRAFNYAIDKEGIVSSVFAGVGAFLPKAPILEPGIVGFVDITEPGEDSLYAYDPERARSLLKMAGYEDRDGDGIVEDPRGEELSLSLWSSTGRFKGYEEVAELVQQMISDIGVRVDLQIFEYATFTGKIGVPYTEAEYDMVLFTWGIPTADPDEPLMLLTFSESWKPYGHNRMMYSNEQVDAIALAQHQEVDPAKRQDLIEQWERLVAADAPWIILPTLSINLVKRTYVHGDEILPVDLFPCRFAWLDQDEMERQGVNR